MSARVDEVADGVVRISVHRPDGLRGGLVYNQFLILGERPLLVHTGMRTIFPTVLDAARRVLDVSRLAWISGGHASRPDEFGAVNEWLAVAPSAQVSPANADPGNSPTSCFTRTGVRATPAKPSS